LITIFEILFYTILFLVINSFWIYPLVVYLIGSYKPQYKIQNEIMPSVSILIAARNEEKVIGERIENIAALDYDFSKLELIVGSDASNESTNEILVDKQKVYPWLKIFLSTERKGKAGILNELIKKVNNEILVFTDANTEFKKDALKNLVQDFARKEVGGVCGKLVLIDDEAIRNKGVEESEYWKYETLIKKYEGKCGVLISANGGIFAIRKELYRNISTEKAVTDDLFLSLAIAAQGYIFTYCENAIGFEGIGKDMRAEYTRKLRFSATNFQTLIEYKKLFLGKNHFLAYAFLSHKVTRWILPWLLLLLFVLSIFLAQVNTLIFVLMVMEMFFYLFAFMGWMLSLVNVRVMLFSLPYFFVVSNVAVAMGLIRFLKKEHSVIWESTKR
jgi:poly-beta-1,6-N-acetyl-D-glucosamine synthase